MNNIWQVMIQTGSVTLVAGLILVLKYVFMDKLSPRWQYGVWGILVLRIIFPVTNGTYVLLPIPMWTEIWKSKIEAYLESAYSGVYESLEYPGVMPWVNSMPMSITDWLFILYCCGVIVVIGWYVFRYVQLGRIIRRGESISKPMEKKVQVVCKKYELKCTRVTMVKGITSAFIYGVFRPILVLPKGEDVDEKILLHELLHLKNYDSIQSVLWCMLYALYWFNPFLYYIFCHIGNDMEAVCDQRVLERLEGEERREYGTILLSMANEKYARAIGTTSISNGGKNIAHRIQAIVRFKKYPKGMSLVSICIMILLIGPTIEGTAATYDFYDYFPDEEEISYALAAARENRCNTVASAVDVYVKSIFYENGILRGIVSPLEKQEEILEHMRQSVAEGWVSYHLDAGGELEYATPLDDTYSYALYNLKQESDKMYTGNLLLRVTGFLMGDGEGLLLDDEGSVICEGIVALPVRIYESDGWCVEECGKRVLMPGEDLKNWWGDTQEIDSYREVSAVGEYGEVMLRSDSRYLIFNNELGREEISSSVEFSTVDLFETVSYVYKGERGMLSNSKWLRLAKKDLESIEEETIFTNEASFTDMINGGSSNGDMSVMRRYTSDEWDGTIGTSQGGTVSTNAENGLAELSDAYAVGVWLDGEVLEAFMLEGE